MYVHTHSCDRVIYQRLVKQMTTVVVSMSWYTFALLLVELFEKNLVLWTCERMYVTNGEL